MTRRRFPRRRNSQTPFLVTMALTLTFAFLFASALEISAADDPNPAGPRPFAHPDRIHYDGDCLTIDGKDTFIYSGAFHYFRCPKPLWRERFQKIHDAGFNAVETYVAWNWSERQMPAGLDDYSKVDLADLDDWLTMAEQFGFYVIVRPGPYICAEWDTGGFPQWLLTKKPAKPLRDRAWLRTDDPVFLAWCRHWFNAVCPVIARHQITAKAPGEPGVILVQLENEYDYAGLPADIMLRQVKALEDDAHAKGIDVPLFTCWTAPVRRQNEPWLRRIFDSCNFYPRWGVDEIAARMQELRRVQPDAPLMTTELQGGWFSNVGGKLSLDQDGLTAAQINNLTLFAIQNGDTIMNYYMLFGGTNPGDWAARNITTTYDYAAPIHEWGTVGDRYQRVWALGHMLREHGPRLARAHLVPCDVTTDQKDVTVALRRSPDGSRYLFVRTDQHKEPRQGHATVKERDGSTPEIQLDYHLEPFGSMVLYLPPGVSDPAQGEWLPKPAPPLETVTPPSAGVIISSALRRADPGPEKWSDFKPGQDLADAGIDDSQFIFYQANLAGSLTNLFVQRPEGDDVIATLDQRPLNRLDTRALYTVFGLPASSGNLLMLYENHGHANGGSAMEAPCGLVAAHTAADWIDPGRPITGWRMRLVDSTRRRPEVRANFKDDDWPTADVTEEEPKTLTPGQSAVYRASVELTAADLAQPEIDVRVGCVDDEGWVYVNGHRVGHCDDWSRPFSFDSAKYLHAGHNVIAVVIHNKDGPGGLGRPELTFPPKGTPAPIARFGLPAGVTQGWWEPHFNDNQWETVNLGADAANPPSSELLEWYRLKFHPLAPLSDATPLRLHLEAGGNGFLYLNGHALGRYWDVGPQHDFFLPGCWLNDGENVLTISLRPTSKPAAIQSAIVEPYEEARAESTPPQL